MIKNFWKDESGSIISAELVLISTLVTLPLITGLVQLRQALDNKLNFVKTSIEDLNQDININIQVDKDDPKNRPMEILDSHDIYHN